MAEAFDPDKYLKEKVSAGASGDFDPDKYLAEKAPKEQHWYDVTGSGLAQAFKNYIPSMPHGDPSRPWYDMTAKGTGQAMLNAVPAVGAVVGGLGGAVGGPVGAAAGSSAGAAAGESLRSGIQSAVDGKNPTAGQFYSNLGNAAKSGAEAQMGAASLGVMGKVAANKLSSLPSELTGIPDKDVETYADRADKVNEIISEHSENGKFNSQQAVNHMRDNVLNDVRKTRMHLDNQISTALDSAPHTKSFPIAPIKEAIADYATQLHPVYDEAEIGQVNDIVNKIDKVAPDGVMSLQDMQATKRMLQNVASGSYDKSGNFFRVGNGAVNAAKMGGRAAKETLDQFGPPEIRNANRQLAQLHDIEDSMSSTILNKNSPPHTMLSAGTGANVRDASALANLGEITGQDYLGDAANISAARSFANAPMLPKTTTGRSLIGPIYGGTMGNAIGAPLGPLAGTIGRNLGATAGAMASSPAMLKAAIEQGAGPAAISKALMSTTIRSKIGKGK